MDFYINLYEQEDKSGKRPHYRILFKHQGKQYECALWPNKDGKAGFSGKVKEKEARVTEHSEAKANAYQPEPQKIDDVLGADQDIPF